jgi:electron transfer flavoprotein alpha subunit
MTNHQGVLINCETADGKLAPISAELLGLGASIAKDLGQELSAVLIGSQVAGLASEIIACGAQKVYVVDDPILKNYVTDSYLQVLAKVIQQALPQVVLLGQTPLGRDVTPRLAFRLQTAAVLDCIALEVDPATKRVLMTKPVYGGNALSLQTCDCDPQIATIRAKVTSPAVKDAGRTGEIINVPAGLDLASLRTKVIDRKVEAAAAIKLEDARVIVSGGRGIGGPEGFQQLAELAKTLKAALGASRPPCDSNWVSDTLQVGLTGKLVSPELYIAIGISGSSQHLAGCSGSKVIVAINKDPDANIFKVALYGIVADWKKALPSFTARVKQLQS